MDYGIHCIHSCPYFPTTENPLMTYPSAGNYKVALMVNDSDGDYSFAWLNVTVTTGGTLGTAYTVSGGAGTLTSTGLIGVPYTVVTLYQNISGVSTPFQTPTKNISYVVASTNGNYRLPAEPNGPYMVTFSANGYVTVAKNITINNADITLNVVLTSTPPPPCTTCGSGSSAVSDTTVLWVIIGLLLFVLLVAVLWPKKRGKGA
jgi:hypothetical protein